MLVVFMRAVTKMRLETYVKRVVVYERASDASSASLNLPGRNQVIDLREDSRLEIVETLFMRNVSYLAREKDMSERRSVMKSVRWAELWVRWSCGESRFKSAL